MEPTSLFNLQGEKEFNIFQVQDWQCCIKSQRKTTCRLVSLLTTHVTKQEVNLVTVYFLKLTCNSVSSLKQRSDKLPPCLTVRTQGEKLVNYCEILHSWTFTADKHQSAANKSVNSPVSSCTQSPVTGQTQWRWPHHRPSLSASTPSWTPWWALHRRSGEEQQRGAETPDQ